MNSESSSIRSDSPGLGMPNARLMEPQRIPILGFQSQGQTMIIPNDRQTPPPLPPRGVRPDGGVGRGTPPPPPPPIPPQTYNDHRKEQLHPLGPALLPVGPGQPLMRLISGQKDLRPPGIVTNGPHRGMSPILGGHHPVIMPNQMQHSPTGMTAQAMLAQNPQPSHGRGAPPPPPPSDSSSSVHSSPMSASSSPAMHKGALPYGQPPPYSLSYQQVLPNKPSPTLAYPTNEQSPTLVSHNSSPLSSHSASPAAMFAGAPSQAYSPGPETLSLNNGAPPRPAPMQAWNATQLPVITQQVSSRQVLKPVLQTATAPLSPPPGAGYPLQGAPDYERQQPNYISSVQAQVNTPSPSPSPVTNHHPHHPHHPHDYYPPPETQRLPNVQIELTRNHTGQKSHMQTSNNMTPQMVIQIHNQGHGQIQPNYPANSPEIGFQQAVQRFMYNSSPGQRSNSPVSRNMNQSPMSVISTTSTHSTNSDIPDKPPPPYPGKVVFSQTVNSQPAHHHNINLQSQYPVMKLDDLHDIPEEYFVGYDTLADPKLDLDTQSESSSIDNNPEESRLGAAKRRLNATKLQNYSPQAYKFYMEQHIENIFKNYHQRAHRKAQLETEMQKVGLSEEAQTQMRKMLHQKESNYIRLKRAKMSKSMFEKKETLGIGAFGEVALVRKIDTEQLYAMKTLRKRDVLQRNQEAHVKAERDILAEADNEWVVKLYYSFQDKENLYFVMDYIPGGDLMSLLIKFGIFQEHLAQFYVAELVLAIESVHNMGFIHRDIKPDNILIDKDGHIKLTDFGLCTGFRWTHNSKYYQKGKLTLNHFICIL